jgi:hypothetical protein
MSSHTTLVHEPTVRCWQLRIYFNPFGCVDTISINTQPTLFALLSQCLQLLLLRVVTTHHFRFLGSLTVEFRAQYRQRLLDLNWLSSWNPCRKRPLSADNSLIPPRANVCYLWLTTIAAVKRFRPIVCSFTSKSFNCFVLCDRVNIWSRLSFRLLWCSTHSQTVGFGNSSLGSYCCFSIEFVAEICNGIPLLFSLRPPSTFTVQFAVHREIGCSFLCVNCTRQNKENEMEKANWQLENRHKTVGNMHCNKLPLAARPDVHFRSDSVQSWTGLCLHLALLSLDLITLLQVQTLGRFSFSAPSHFRCQTW